MVLNTHIHLQFLALFNIFPFLKSKNSPHVIAVIVQYLVYLFYDACIGVIWHSALHCLFYLSRIHVASIIEAASTIGLVPWIISEIAAAVGTDCKVVWIVLAASWTLPHLAVG